MHLEYGFPDIEIYGFTLEYGFASGYHLRIFIFIISPLSKAPCPMRLSALLPLDSEALEVRWLMESVGVKKGMKYYSEKKGDYEIKPIIRILMKQPVFGWWS